MWPFSVSVLFGSWCTPFVSKWVRVVFKGRVEPFFCQTLLFFFFFFFFYNLWARDLSIDEFIFIFLLLFNMKQRQHTQNHEFSAESFEFNRHSCLPLTLFSFTSDTQFGVSLFSKAWMCQSFVCWFGTRRKSPYWLSFFVIRLSKTKLKMTISSLCHIWDLTQSAIHEVLFEFYLRHVSLLIYELLTK